MGAGSIDALAERRRESAVYDGQPADPEAVVVIVLSLVISIAAIRFWNRASRGQQTAITLVGGVATIAVFVLLFVVPIARGCLARQG